MTCMRGSISSLSSRRRLALTGDHAVVVEPKQRNHVAYVCLGLDLARREALSAGEDRVIVDPALLLELRPDRFRKARMECMVAVQVTDLPAADLERELAAASRPRVNARPRGDLLGDLLARRS